MKYPKEIRKSPMMRKVWDEKNSLQSELAQERGKVSSLQEELDEEKEKVSDLQTDLGLEKEKISDIQIKRTAVSDLLGEDAIEIKNAFQNWDTITAAQRWVVVKKVLKALIINEVQE